MIEFSNFKSPLEFDTVCAKISCSFVLSYTSSRVANVVVSFYYFFHTNSFIFESKVEKKDMIVFSTHFVPLISILAPQILKEHNCQL